MTTILQPAKAHKALDLSHADPAVNKSLDDNEGMPTDHIEFGGSLGTLALMITFPALMWYMWIGATFYDGHFPMPSSSQTTSDFITHLCNLVYTHAYPTFKAWATYWLFFLMEMAFYYSLPGVSGYGKQLPHEGNQQLQYFCNAYASFYATIVVAAALHVSGVYPLYTIIDEFGSIMTVAILSGFVNSLLVYMTAFARGRTHRLSGYPIYDFFMGAELNPRIGILDLKMFYEVRIPWFILFLISCAVGARQYEDLGYVSGEVMFLILAHFLYANACAKAEQLIITSWCAFSFFPDFRHLDSAQCLQASPFRQSRLSLTRSTNYRDMYYEKLGFMLTFWNMAGVPFSYCHCALYFANHPPSSSPSSSTTFWSAHPCLLALFTAFYLVVYWIWDSANGQKNAFRQMERGQYVERKTFPQMPWRVIQNPKTIKTERGETIMVDGWFGIVRKPHYPCDAWFAISWGLITGFQSVRSYLSHTSSTLTLSSIQPGVPFANMDILDDRSPLPWFYPVFFCIMIAHRTRRDIIKCRNKYGKAWEQYEREVPYLFIPVSSAPS